MGYGTWKKSDFESYSRSRGREVGCSGEVEGTYSNQEMFYSKTLDPALNPKNVVRECCDSEEHPDTIPVILALDVTGSMGQTAVEVAKKLNVIMTKLYSQVKDVQFLIMGIGDLTYDRYPIQASQFESDIRIADQMEKIYFEFGGGSNPFESYTAAWYFASRHTKLDCWKRGKRGILITMGDEQLNPYLPLKGHRTSLQEVMGDYLQTDIETSELYPEVVEKYDVYHLNVNHRGESDYLNENIEDSFREYLDKNHFKKTTLNNITDDIIEIIVNATKGTQKENFVREDKDSWIAW